MRINEQNEQPRSGGYTWADRIEAKWNEVKGDMLKAFGRLTEDDLKEAAGNRDKLIGQLMSRYQLTREQAEQRLFTWEQSLP